VAPKPATSGKTIEVQPGDTLYLLARRYGVTVAALMEANGLQSEVLKPGQRLTLPAGAALVSPEIVRQPRTEELPVKEKVISIVPPEQQQSAKRTDSSAKTTNLSKEEKGSPISALEGTWVGSWSGGGSSASITIEQDRVSEYLFRGSPQPITKSRVIGDGARFGSGSYTIILKLIAPGTLDAQYSGPNGNAIATLTRR
jgi:LysM repeat protein